MLLWLRNYWVEKVQKVLYLTFNISVTFFSFPRWRPAYITVYPFALITLKKVSQQASYRNHTLGSSPNWANCTSFSKLRAVLMMSLHFLGVSSTFPARKRQHAPVTWWDTNHNITWSIFKEEENLTNTIFWTYISRELLEGVKHVEAVEIYDASCQCVIMSEDESQGYHENQS